MHGMAGLKPAAKRKFALGLEMTLMNTSDVVTSMDIPHPRPYSRVGSRLAGAIVVRQNQMGSLSELDSDTGEALVSSSNK